MSKIVVFIHSSSYHPKPLIHIIVEGNDNMMSYYVLIDALRMMRLHRMDGSNFEIILGDRSNPKQLEIVEKIHEFFA